ncbi:hypothetical protein BJ912DRAFT_1141392 [Pholiota molesta]|nr:hypothetical protein BJ912DRAFT_1141392 [Pholiota molesta]
MPAHAQNPFAQLSTTVLLAIFYSACDYQPVSLPLHSSHPRHVLSSVCKGWYDVVRSTGALWDKIHFGASAGDAHQPHPLLLQLEFCANLSGSNPLTITFDTVFDGWAFSFVDLVIIPHVHHIQNLKCMVQGNNEIKKFLTIGESRFSILESLDICFVNELLRQILYFLLEDCLKFTTLLTAPCLRHATFHLVNGLHPIDLHLPWGQLSTLDLGTVAMPPDIFIKILHAATWRLEDANFYVRFSKPMHPRLTLSKRRVTMHALRMWRLRLHSPSQDTRLFSLLRLPALQKLYIEMYDYSSYQDWDLPMYTKLLGASNKTLRELYMDDYPPHGSKNNSFVVRYRYRKITHQVLAKFFRVISNVENLHLPVGLDIDAATLNKMASYTLLPKLSSLELSSLHGWPILAMARRRLQLFIDASRAAEQAEFEPGPARRPVIAFRPPTSIHVLIPRRWSVAEKRALIQEAQALGLLGIACAVQSTSALPLPVVDLRDVMRARLLQLARIEGVPTTQRDFDF